MKFNYQRILYDWIAILFATFFCTDVSLSCPSDVSHTTQHCLHTFHSLLNSLKKSGDRFITGVDVETIRLIYSSWDQAMDCVRTVSGDCSVEELNKVSSLLSPHVNVNQMCKHKYLFEDYAMSQHCFQRLRDKTEQCFDVFMSVSPSSSSSSSNSRQHRSASRHRVASSSSSSSSQGGHHNHHHYCSRVRRLTDCVKAYVREECDRKAEELVEGLVRASLPSPSFFSSSSSSSASSSPSHVECSERNEHDALQNSGSNRPGFTNEQQDKLKVKASHSSASSLALVHQRTFHLPALLSFIFLISPALVYQ